MRNTLYPRFRYWNANQGKEYFSNFRYELFDGDQIGKFGDTEWYWFPFKGTGPFDLPLHRPNPPKPPAPTAARYILQWSAAPGNPLVFGKWRQHELEGSRD